MSVSDPDRVDNAANSQSPSVSSHLVPEIPSDVSGPANIPSNDSASSVLLKEDASNGHASIEPSLPDASTEAHDTADGHSHSVFETSIIHNEERVEHESKVAAEDAQGAPALESGPTTSNSVAAEKDLDAVAAHVSVAMKEADTETTNGPEVVATTTEHPEPLTTESVMAIADTAAEESVADQSIGHDSGIEILVPALEKKEEEGKDDVPADKPYMEVVEAVAVVDPVEDTLDDTNNTQVDESSVEQVTQVEEMEATIPMESEKVSQSNGGEIPVPDVDAEEPKVAREDNATQVDVVIEDQPQVEATPEELAVETNGSEGETTTVRGVEVEQEVVHEAGLTVAEINNVEDNNHEATIEHQPAQDAPQTIGNGHEATFQRSEEPEVTVHVQDASSIAEYPVAVDVVETTEEPANDEGAAVQASVELASEEVVTGVASEEVPVPVEAEPVAEVTTEEVPAPGEVAVTETASEEAPAAVEVEDVREERIEAPATVDEDASKEISAPTEAVMAGQIQAPVDDAVADEEVPAYAEIEIVAEAASEDVSAPVESQPVTSDGVAEPVEVEIAVEIAVESEPAEEVTVEETSAVVEAEVVTSEEVPAPEISSEDVPAPVEDKPTAEAIEAAASTEAVVPAPVETESVVEVSNEETSTAVESEHIISEETPAPAETEPVVEAIEASTLDDVANEAPVETLVVAEGEAVKLEPVVSHETPMPVEAEPAAEAIEAAISAEIANEKGPAPVEVESVAEEPLAAEPVVSEETPATDEGIPAPVEAEITISAVNDVKAPTRVCETAPVREEIVADVELLTNDAPLLVSDAEPLASVQALKDREAPESQAGIRVDTEAEVVSKTAPVALATYAVEETPSTVLSEPVKDGSEEESAPAENLSADVSVSHITSETEEQPTEVVEDDAAGEAEPLTELKTEPLSIQTSVDTTPFTPIVDSGIELKEQESQPPNLLSIVEEIERPKSPWSHSFQVTSVGQGNLLEDAPVQDTSEFNDAIKTVAVAPILIVEDASGALAATASENLPSTAGQSFEPARPWTPSYSVHSQGSPVQVTDVPPPDDQHVDEVMPPADTRKSEQVQADISSTVEDNEAVSEQVAEVVVTQQETGEVSVSGSEVEGVAHAIMTDTTEPLTEVAETPVIAVADEGVKEVLEPHEEISSDAPESSARLWTPSYAVHEQGSPLQPPEELDVVLAENVEAIIESEAEEGVSKAEAICITSEQSIDASAMDAALITPTVDIENVDEANTTTAQGPADDTALEVSGTPWAPSYSVHAQGTPVVKSVDLEIPTSVGSAYLAEHGTLSYSVHLPKTKDVEEATAELPVLSMSTESSENMTPEATEEPWTPSYSVHLQGSPLLPRTELDGTYSDAEPHVVLPSADAWTPSYSIHSQGSPMIVTKELDESPNSPTLETSAESWTPSYSVHSQGTPLVAPKELEDIPVQDAMELEVENEAQQIAAASSRISQTDSVAVESHIQNNDAVPTTDAEPDKHINKDNEAILPAIVVPVISLASFGTTAESTVSISEVEVSAWTPSYSVHSQGSPSLNPVTMKDEQPSEDQAAPAWVPSYSTSVQGTGVEKTENEASSGIVAHPDVEHSAPVQTDAVTSNDKTISALLVSGAVLSAEFNAATDVPERPWAPSYSVTQQGSGLPLEGEELNKPESLSQPIPEASVPNDTEPRLNEVQQSNESNAVQLRPGQAVGSAEDVARNEKFMLFGLRAIVAYLWVLPRWLSMTRSPSSSGHSRRESSSSYSSSSSKFFPGGWFSTKPNEGRTSLDTAQGEFAASPKMSTSDAFETVNAETMYREAGPSSSVTTVEDGTDGQNRRWCIVM